MNNGRILAIDFGLKRTGLAVTDPLQMFAQPLDTIPTNEILTFIENYSAKEKITEIVVGYPLTLKYELNDIWSFVEKKIHEIQIKFPHIKLNLMDERYTSSIAQQAIAVSGIGKEKRKDKNLIDKISAAIMLNNYLELRKNQKKQD
jgi:putative Holliday junction resolvase